MVPPPHPLALAVPLFWLCCLLAGAAGGFVLLRWPQSQSPVVLPPPLPRSSSPQSRAVLEHSVSSLKFHLTVPQIPETKTLQDATWEGTAMCFAEFAASRALPTPRQHPTADHRLLSSVSISSHKDCSPGPRVLTFGTPVCVLFLSPAQSLEFSLPGGCLKITVSFINGLIGLLLPLILASHVQLGCLWVPAL